MAKTSSVSRVEKVEFAEVFYLGSSSVTFPYEDNQITEVLSALVSDYSNKNNYLTVTFNISTDQKISFTNSDNTKLFEDTDLRNVILVNHSFRSDIASCIVISFSKDKNNRPDDEEKCIFFKFPSIYSAYRFRLIFKHLKNNSNCVQDLRTIDKTIRFQIEIDILEDDGSNLSPVSKEAKSGIYKIRSHCDKKILINIYNFPTELIGIPIKDELLKVNQCLGVYMCFGRYKSIDEMIYLETISKRTGNNEIILTQNEQQEMNLQFNIEANWSCKENGLLKLNEITDKERFIFITMRIILAFENIKDPVSFQVVLKARVYRQEEKFWFPEKRAFTWDMFVNVNERISEDSSLMIERFNLNKIKFQSALPEMPAFLDEDLVRNQSKGSDISSDSEEDSVSSLPINSVDESKVMSSGQGTLDKDINDIQIEEWGSFLLDWQNKSAQLASLSKTQCDKVVQNTPSYRLNNIAASVGLTHKSNSDYTRGPNLNGYGLMFKNKIIQLCSQDIPDAIRGEVWNLLTDSNEEHSKRMEVYRILITKFCSQDDVIIRDLARTYPAHEMFSTKKGQDALFSVNHAYALYDVEIGYCQGISFIAACLLLHMPEEQSFSLLVDIMEKYNYRKVYANKFEGLHMILYQFDRLVEERIPNLWRHFTDLKIESHMYASQWFLTLFTAKFPLAFVFRILDIFLSQGVIILYKLSLVLLMSSVNDLLGLDFEGVLKHFRIVTPYRFKSGEYCDSIISQTLELNISVKKLKKLEDEFMKKKISATTPENSLERENINLKSMIEKLRGENQKLLEEMDAIKATKSQEKSALEGKEINLRQDLQKMRDKITFQEEHINIMNEQVLKLKEMFMESERERHAQIETISMMSKQYRKIFNDFHKRIEASNRILVDLKEATIKLCEADPSFAERIEQILPSWKEKCQEFVKTVVRNSDGNEGDQFNESESALKILESLNMQLTNSQLSLVELQAEYDLLRQRSASQPPVNQPEKNAPKSGNWISKGLNAFK